MFTRILAKIKGIRLNLLTISVGSLALGFIFLYTLPEPANAVLFITAIAVIFYYVAYTLYKSKP